MITLTREEAQNVLNLLILWLDEQEEPDTETAVELLRAKLSEPEPQPVAWRKLWEGETEYTYYWSCRYKGSQPLYTTPPPQREPERNCTRSHPHENMDAMCELRTEISRLTNENARLKAQPEPEPVAWMEIENYLDEENLWCERKVLSEYDNGRNMPLYTAPPQRESVYCGCGDEIVAGDGARCGTCVAVKFKEKEWVGLTDSEKKAIYQEATNEDWTDLDVINATEAKLKEKNFGNN